MAKAKKEDNAKELLKELNIKKEDLIEEIKSDIKENLNDEILARIDYESKNKLDKMEKRIYRYKNGSILKRNILILIFLVIIVYETKVLYDNNLLFGLNKKEADIEIKEDIKDNENEIKKEEIIEEEKNLEWYIDNYGYLLENIETNLIDEDEYYLYEKDYNVESIKNSVKLNISYQILDDVKRENSIIEVNEEDLKNSYIKVFGNIDNYKAENFNDNCIQFIYNKELEKYMAIDTTCNKSNEKIYRSIRNIYEEEDKLIIETFVGLINEEEKKLSTIDKKDTYEYSIDNISKLPVYKFIYEKKEDNYYLKRIEKSE